MNAPEPLLVATAHHAFRDVETKLATWRDALSARHSVIAAEFAGHLVTVDLPSGTDFAEYAEWKADSVIENWCKHRQAWVDEITHALSPDTIVVAQSIGVAGQLGDLIRLHLDNSLRDLDGQLRETITETAKRAT